MKLHRAGLVLLGLAVVFTLALVVSRPPIPQALSGAQFTSEDIRQIQQAVRQARWQIARSLFLRHEFSRAFRVWASGGIKEVGDQRLPRIGVGNSLAFAPGASVRCKGQYGQKDIKYELEQTTNGWKVAVVAFP